MPNPTDRLKGRAPTLERWEGERRDWHRAMLLWAMQHPEDRSNRAVARAMGVSEGSVRTWKVVRCWLARASTQGARSDQVALDMYRDEYMSDFGAHEMPHVAGNIVRAVGAVDLADPSAAAATLARDRVRNATGVTLSEVEQASVREAADRRIDVRQDAEKHLKLVDAGLGYIVGRLKLKKVRVTLGDLPKLLEARSKLVHVVNGTHGGAAGGVVKSARVKHAEDTGGDVLDAMYDDAQEVILILGALRTRKGADVEALAADENALRAELSTVGGA